MAADSTNRIVEVEREILCGLCNALPSDPAFETAKQALQGYAWRYYEHRVVFSALERISIPHFGSLKEQLPAVAVRMGFPDVDWKRYFDSGEAEGNLEQLLRELKQLAGDGASAGPKPQRADDRRTEDQHRTSRDWE